MRAAKANCLRCKAPLRPQAQFCRRCGLLIAPASSDDDLAGHRSPLYQPKFRNAPPPVPPIGLLTSQQTLPPSQFPPHPQSKPQNSALAQRGFTMNANDAKLVSVYPRETKGNIPSGCLRVSGAADGENVSFEVVVEARAGWVLGLSGAPYVLSLVAFDITSGRNAEPCAAFMKTMAENFTPATGNSSQWPEYRSVFPVTLTGAQADTLVGHILQYTVTLISPPPGSGCPANIVSFMRSELFILI